MNTRQTLQRKLFLLTTFPVLLLGGLSATSVAAQTCEKLTGLKLANSTITAAQPVAQGEFVPATGSPTPFKDLPAFCRVTGVIKPTPDSDIRFEVWMPSAGWNGKFQGITASTGPSGR